MDVEADSVNEVLVDQIDMETQSNSVSPTLSFCDAETQIEITGEFLDRLEFKLKSTGPEKDKLANKKRRVDYRFKETSRTEKCEVSHFKI